MVTSYPPSISRALAGLSMGGFVVMHTGLPHLDTFSELYVYSSGHVTEEALKQFEENFAETFKDPKFNDQFRAILPSLILVEGNQGR
jgi:enterochelin esterase-like enzyme